MISTVLSIFDDILGTAQSIDCIKEANNVDKLCNNRCIVAQSPYLTLPYLTLPFGAVVLPPSTEASKGPNAHPRINPKVIETFGRFLQTGGGCSSVPVLGHLFLRNAFQRIHIASQRWHSSCLKDASWYLPLLHRVDTEDHPFSSTRWDVGSKCCAWSEGQLIILSPSWTVVQCTV